MASEGKAKDVVKASAERLQSWGAAYATLRETAFAGQVVEIALKAQVAFLVLLVAGVPFGALGGSLALGFGLIVQAAVTWFVLEMAWRRQLSIARWIYCAIAVVTFFEAMRNTGIPGGIFGIEAILSIVATWYIFALHRQTLPQAPDDEGQSDG
ncbi:MAG: hypothetical protein AAFU49_06140 [Pseudomonadota bacterium]